MIGFAPLLLALLGTVLMGFVIFAPAAETPQRAAATPDAAVPAASNDVRVHRTPAWTALVDPRAAGCDAAVRLELVEALGATGRPWATAILARAAYDEPDALVRAAIERALASPANVPCYFEAT